MVLYLSGQFELPNSESYEISAEWWLMISLLYLSSKSHVATQSCICSE